jgi:hypothetical protein
MEVLYSCPIEDLARSHVVINDAVRVSSTRAGFPP